MGNKISFKVGGMHCSSCEKLIKEELESTGAKEIQIDHKTGLGSLVTENSDYGAETLIKAVERAGYTATIINE